MGKTKRKYNAELMRFRKSLRRPLINILQIMPNGFSEDMFVSEFKALYAYLWDDICAKSQEYHRMDVGLQRKGFPKRYYFPSPNNYLRTIAAPIIKNKRLYNELKVDSEKREELKLSLKQRCEAIQKRREERLKGNLKYVQAVNPSYSNYYIETYFEIKHHNPIDVDARYAVLVEASKYKSPETIKFLHKVNASERNFHLRDFAFSTLQKFGIKEVRLRKNRKGKKRQGDELVPIPIETPKDLINHIYNSQLEQMKSYDLFISHSSTDSELLLQLKSILNCSSINVYIDWVNDKEALKRELTNVDTANAIIERLKSSKALLYIHTNASLNSRWTPWELGFFHALKNKVCVYNPDNIEKAPYLDVYPNVVLKNGLFFIETNTELLPLKDWIEHLI